MIEALAIIGGITLFLLAGGLLFEWATSRASEESVERIRSDLQMLDLNNSLENYSIRLSQAEYEIGLLRKQIQANQKEGPNE